MWLVFLTRLLCSGMRPQEEGEAEGCDDGDDDGDVDGDAVGATLGESVGRWLGAFDGELETPSSSLPCSFTSTGSHSVLDAVSMASLANAQTVPSTSSGSAAVL